MDHGPSVQHNINLDDSTSSSDAADVLIRSTKVVPEQKGKKVVSEGELSNNCNVNIFIRRLSNSAHSSCLEDTFNNGLMEQVVPPVLPANMPSALIRGFVEGEDQNSSDQPPRKSHVPRAGKAMLKTPVIHRESQEQKEQDVHISRYSADGRGAVAAALKQRSHSAPLRREVKVQFLDSGSLHSSEFRGPEVQPSPSFPSGDVGGASTVAAITAAAIAATAPLIKAQSDMEARMAQVASELRRLQDSEGRTDRAPESRAASDADRVTQLEVQLTALTQQRLQHLERIQGQQLELQNRLLGSALTAVTASTIPPSQSTHHSDSPSDSAQRANFSTFISQSHKFAAEGSPTVVQEQSREAQAGREKSPLETPAPRKVIPRPTHWNPALQDSQQGSSKGRKATHKSHGNGRLLEQIPNNQRSPTRCPAHSVGVRRVAIATVDSQPEQSRENQPEAFIFSTGRPGPEESADALTKPSSKQDIQTGLKDVTSLTDGAPESSTSAVQQANAMLQDLSRIKNEMRSLFRTADVFPVKSAEASRSSRSSRPALPSTTPPPPPVPPVSMQGDVVTSGAARAQPTVPQNSQPPASMFEDAGRVLRQVRHSRKVLEENLQAVLRAKDGEALHTQLEALSNNRDASEELRIKKTVDAWINTLSKEIQNELVHPGSAAQSKSVERGSGAAAVSVVQRDQSSRSRNTPGTGRGRVTTGRKGKGSTAVAAAATGVARRRQQSRAEAASTQPSNQHLSSSLRNSSEENPQASVVLQSEDDEAYLAKIYGKALYEGHRRTLKKGPYLRFSSPSPKSKGQRPKVIESVKGVKMKSSKTQTSMSGAQDSSSLLQPAVSEPQYLFSPSGPVQQQQPGCSVPGFLIPMAIPLGKPKVDGQAPLPSRVIISNKPATVITSFTPTITPKLAPSVRKPNTVLLEVHSGQRIPTPQLQIQVQPSVNIESVTAPSPDLSSPLHIPAPDVQAGADTRSLGEEDEEDDGDDDGFPGTKFLAVDDIQEPEVDGEAPEEAPIELNGLPSPPAALYHGPAFPLEPRQTGPLTEPVLSTIQQRETLENRLVDWVEQQLMARMISGMFPQPAQTDPANLSEPDDSVTSDIVETAGGGGLQLFVDAGVPVDSELIRQYVNEVLAEIITLMLGQREGPREPAAPASIQETHTRQKTPVPTPVPTPEPSERESPPVQRKALSPVSTPDLSEQPSPVQSHRDSPPEQPQPTSPEPAKALVGTPASTPLSSPRRIATPSPPPELEGLHNHPWGNAELPLKEEEPHSEEEEKQPAPLNVLSVAREEEEEAVLPPSSPVLSKPLSPPVSAVEEASPAPPPESPSVEESSSQASPSLTETETETAARHISEGELLLSTGQMAAVRALEEEGFTVPNLMTSFNSSLHGVQDMDYDPPSEGQVIRRHVVPAHHDPILSLLARMEQGPVSQSQHQERYWDEESSGEVSEGQRPVLTTAQEKVVTGHSLILQQPSQPTLPTAEHSPHATMTSPGQLLVQHTGLGNGAVGEDSGLSINFRPSETHAETSHALHSFTASSPQPEDSTDKQAAEAPQTLHRPAPILVKQYQHKDESDLLTQRGSSNDADAFFEDMDKGAEVSPHAGGGVGLMSVRLPSVQKDDVSPNVSTIEGDSDSANDVF